MNEPVLSELSGSVQAADQDKGGELRSAVPALTLEQHAAVRADVLGVPPRVVARADVCGVVLVEALQVLIALQPKKARALEARLAAARLRRRQTVHMDPGVEEGHPARAALALRDREHADVRPLGRVEVADQGLEQRAEATLVHEVRDGRVRADIEAPRVERALELAAEDADS